MVYFKPKDPKISNLMDRLTQTPAIKIDSSLAKQLGRYDKIRYIRDKNHLYIGKDHGKNKSIVYLDGLQVERKGSKYFFKGL